MKVVTTLLLLIPSFFLNAQEDEFKKLREAEEAYKKEHRAAEDKYAKDTEDALRKLHLEYLKYEMEMEKAILAFEGKNLDPRLVERAKALERISPRNITYIKEGDAGSVLRELEKNNEQIRNRPTEPKAGSTANAEKKKQAPKEIKQEPEPPSAGGKTVDNEVIPREEIEANRPVYVPLKKKDYTISSNFNPNRLHPVLKKPRPHKGIDLAAKKETPIYASANGIVEIAQFSKSAGNWVLLNHQNEYKTKYFHLSRTVIKPNDVVKAGDVIGYVGTTGYSSGPHLHYEIRNKNIPLDPRPFLLSHFE